MDQDEILTKYNNCMSELENQFPMDIESLKQYHKSTLSKILPSELQNSLPTNLEKLLNSSFMKYQEENEQIYINSLYTFLSNEYSQIKTKVEENVYMEISDYIKDLNTFQKNIETKVQEGPNKSLHINEFILDQILNDINTIIDYKKSGYDIQFNDKQKEIEKISDEIQQTKDICKNLLLNIKQNENLIKQNENDKNYIIKQSTSNADKISKNLKNKADIIYKLNQQIEEIETKQNKIINELKEKINLAKNTQTEKDKLAGNSKTEFETKKIELQTRIDFLEKQIKNINESRTKILKSMISTPLMGIGDNTLKKFEEQIVTLSKKIEN